MLRVLGLFNPTIRELGEISYQVDEPFVLDTSKYREVLGEEATPLAQAIDETVAWYRALIQENGKGRPS
jgi:nucleoside-diphosphate-sugar epimerase